MPTNGPFDGPNFPPKWAGGTSGGGGGGGGYVQLESGTSAVKISALPAASIYPSLQTYIPVVVNGANYKQEANFLLRQGTITDPGLGSNIFIGCGRLDLLGQSAGAYGFGVELKGQSAVADAGQAAYAGGVYLRSGRPDNSSGVVGYNQVYVNGSYIYASGTAAGGGITISSAAIATPGIVGPVSVYGGNNTHGSGTGGNINLQPGTGSTNGVLIVNNIGTADPHVLNAKFQATIDGVGFVGVYSQG